MTRNAPGSTTRFRFASRSDRSSEVSLNVQVFVSTGLELDLGEAAELLHGGRDAAHQVFDVELDGLLAGAVAGVLDLDADRGLAVRRDLPRLDREAAVLERV